MNDAISRKIRDFKYINRKRKVNKNPLNLQCVKALVVTNSVLHDFGFGKVCPAKQL